MKLGGGGAAVDLFSCKSFKFVFKLVQPRPGELNSQIQLNFIGLSNEAREPAWGNGPDQSLRDPHHYAFKCYLYEAVLMSVSILRVF